MTEHIGLLPRLFRGMADLIDQDRRSPSRSEAIVNAAGIAATVPRPRAWWPGGYGTMTALRCWRRDTPSTLECRGGRPWPSRSEPWRSQAR
jgi:hypothetical protein